MACEFHNYFVQGTQNSEEVFLAEKLWQPSGSIAGNVITTQENCSNNKHLVKNTNNYMAAQSEYLRNQISKKKSSSNIGFTTHN